MFETSDQSSVHYLGKLNVAHVRRLCRIGRGNHRLAKMQPAGIIREFFQREDAVAVEQDEFVVGIRAALHDSGKPTHGRRGNSCGDLYRTGLFRSRNQDGAALKIVTSSSSVKIEHCVRAEASDTQIGVSQLRT